LKGTAFRPYVKPAEMRAALAAEGMFSIEQLFPKEDVLGG
jgi:hypothetical protein